jgi:hypothetical protein
MKSPQVRIAHDLAIFNFKRGSTRSCGNRHCPNCQKEKTQAWLEKQTQKLLPVQHFVVTFTVPQELRRLLHGNQKAGFRKSATTAG